jgi:hypothetical protein
MYLEDGDCAVTMCRITRHDISEDNEFHEEYFLAGCQERARRFGGTYRFSLHCQIIGEEISQPKQAENLTFHSHRREIGVLLVTEHSSQPVVSSTLWGRVQRDQHRMGRHSFLQFERAGWRFAGCNSFQMFARSVDFNH